MRVFWVYLVLLVAVSFVVSMAVILLVNRLQVKKITETMFGVVKNMESGLFCMDLKNNCIYCNKRCLEMFQITKKTMDLATRDICNRYINQESLNNPAPSVWQFEKMIKGYIYWFRLEMHTLTNADGQLIGYFFYVDDITEKHIQQEREKEHLQFDELTGLYKKEYFYKKAEEMLRKYPEIEWNMICTNICDFKLINDVFGKQVGDRLLIDQAKALKMADYGKCVHGRISDDHLAMLIPRENYNPSLAAKNTAELQYIVNNSNYRLHILIGVYEIDNVYEPINIMCDKAFIAIGSIGKKYEQIIAYYNDAMIEKGVREKKIVGQLDQALFSGNLYMELQPQVDRKGKIVGAEALVRWNHSELGLLMPDEFIPICEKTGYVFKLDSLIWERAVKTLKKWKEDGRDDLSLSVNISTKDFYYVDLYDYFCKLVSDYDVSPEKLHLEITETVFMKDWEMHNKTVQKLKEKGFIVEIDDFGSGYSSLNLLQDISANVLKLDMAFLRNSANPERRNIIISSIIEMAKKLDMKIIMEGVENQEQLNYLIELGCDYFQGYHVSKPISVQEFEKIA